MSAGNGATAIDFGAAIRSALPELYTLAEAAAQLRMGQSTLRGLARRRKIAHARSGNRLVFSAADLTQYLAARRIEPALREQGPAR
jgi:excisionase family DNA binding protein